MDSKVHMRVKYFNDDLIKMEKILIGDWIDLRAAETVEIKKGEVKPIRLGVAIELPKGYEAYIVPRSSTYKNFGVMQVNSIGIVDESYSGDNDEWIFQAYALRDTKINFNDRICQFRIMKRMPELCIEFVEKLNNKDRGGIGTTGKN